MGKLYKKNGQQLYSKDFVAEDNTGLEKKILKNEWLFTRDVGHWIGGKV